RAVKPLLEKVERGQRLSVAESRTLAKNTDRMSELKKEILDLQSLRALSASTAPSTPDSGSSDTAESRAFTNYIRTGTVAPEMRAAGVGTGSAGGFTVPTGWWERLQVALKAHGGTQADFQLVETDTGQPMQWASNDPTGVIGSLIAENTAIGDQDYVFGQG